MQNICLEFSYIKMSFIAFCRGRSFNVKLILYTHTRVSMPASRNMSMKATASKVLPKFLSELTAMSDETVREKLWTAQDQ